MSDLDEVLPQFCPQCGAGVETVGPVGHGIVCRMPRGWPVVGDCKECERRDRVRMVQAGAKYAMERERRFFEALLGGS